MWMRARASASNAVASMSVRLRQRMEIEVDDCTGDIFDRGKALVEIARGDEPLQKVLRHRLAGLVVQREAAQHLRLLQPVLVKLRRQFDEIGGDIGAGNFRIGDARQQAVQRVAEFVEQRARILEAEQRRLAVGGLGKIADIDDERRDIAGELFLIAQGGHPGAAALSSRARNNRRRRARSCCRRAPRDFPDPHVGMPDRHIRRAA